MTDARPAPQKLLNGLLWLVQALLAAFFVFAGYTKFATAPADLARMIPWTAEHPVLKLVTATADLAGGIGVILPGLTRIRPQLGVLAALGLAVLQVLAIGFHLSRGEASLVPLNFIILPLILFVLWGRGRRLPIAPR